MDTTTTAITARLGVPNSTYRKPNLFTGYF